MVDPLRRAIFASIYHYYDRHQGAQTDAQWDSAAAEMSALSSQYHHPLMDALLVAVYDAIEKEQTP